MVEGLDNEIVLQVLQQPFEALPLTAPYFVRSWDHNDRLSKDQVSLPCVSEQNLGCYLNHSEVAFAVRCLEFARVGTGTFYFWQIPLLQQQ